MTLFTNPKLETRHLETVGEVCFSAPSNIALVKYWGKKGRQLPCNPSLSMTLESSRSYFKLSWRGRTYEKEQLGLTTSFEGKHNEVFHAKISKFLNDLTLHEWPYLKYFDLDLESRNTFPHSAGIASSASSMAALAACLIEMRLLIFGTDEGEFATSYIARLGSGSASRSVSGPFCFWGEISQDLGSPLYAQTLSDIHADLRDLRDTILIIDSGTKSISSTRGHQLMEDHPYASLRFERAHERTKQLWTSLQNGDWQEMAKIIEAEALELHALMMTSNPGYILMRPQTLAAIEKITKFRQQKQIDITYTLDAGANLHVLYKNRDEVVVKDFLHRELSSLCENGRMIHDQAGLGLRKESSFE